VYSYACAPTPAGVPAPIWHRSAPVLGVFGVRMHIYEFAYGDWTTR
jgi:hypothetical protein